MKNISLNLRMKSFANAWRGTKIAIKLEVNLRIHLAIALLVVLAGAFLQISTTEWLVVWLCVGAVVVAELMNTAIEKLVDMVSPQYNQQAGLVKDVAAGAVLVCTMVAAVAGLIIFIPKVWQLIP